MVTHNLRYAVEYGNRILMMHQGHAVLDKAGEEKAKLVVDDLSGSVLIRSVLSVEIKFLNCITEMYRVFIKT